MRLRYDPHADALYVRFDESRITESEEMKAGIIFDFNATNEIVGIEVLDLRRRHAKPQAAQGSGGLKIWLDIEADYLEVIFGEREGFFRHTEDDRVMVKQDSHGTIIGFSVLSFASLPAPLQVTF
jgi:uncharacterized protein YuzE